MEAKEREERVQACFQNKKFLPPKIFALIFSSKNHSKKFTRKHKQLKVRVPKLKELDSGFKISFATYFITIIVICRLRSFE